MIKSVQIGLAGLLIFVLSACAVEGEFPSLADIPAAPEQSTDMEEKRRIAEEMIKNAEPEETEPEEPAPSE